MSTEQTAQSSADATVVAQLEALATAMKLRGFGTAITPSGGGQPHMTAVNKDHARMYEDIYVARAGDDSWWFWWSWADRIWPIGDIEAATVAIAFVLSPDPISA